MASNMVPSSLGEEPRLSTPSRSSFTPPDTGRRPTTPVGSLAVPEKHTLPQRRGPPSTSRYSMISCLGLAPDVSGKEYSPASTGATQDHLGRRASTGPRDSPRSASCSAATRQPMHHTKIQRWAGLTRTVSDWDFLRRDPELWYEDGDCFIHLHARGASRRGPSLRIPFRALRQKKCSAIFSLCDAQMTTAGVSDSQPLRRMPSTLTRSNEEPSTVELFIPVPDEVSREESFRWHITTRNFFAFLLGKPLVGEHMGRAFTDVQQRMILFRPEHTNNLQDFLDYAENQGYRDLVECTDYALASLYYAEHYKLKEVWIDAFAHCVGMNDSLVLSPEYALCSRLTKALITRAHVEVDMRLSRVSTALARFLEDDLSPAYLGIPDSARCHLDHFRRFLHNYYVEKFSYWPPPRGASFPKALYKSMYFDFQSLYDYLADTESTSDISMQKPATGGICVLQNISNFDKRHGFKAQPCPLPLLPVCVSSPRKLDSQKALRQLTLASQHNKNHQLHPMSAALAIASNSLTQDASNIKVIHAYMQFERMYALDASQREEKISAVDARKVRWLLIYGTLQYLVSALRAPKEVRDHDSPDYPLCCVAEQSNWNVDAQQSTPLVTPSLNVPQTSNDYLSEQQQTPSTIEPDCHREDYFTPKVSSRCGPLESPTSPHVSLPLRQSSTRSLVPRSLSMRSSRSSKRTSLTLKPSQHCAITVPGYGDGLNEPSKSGDLEIVVRPVSSVYSQRSSWSVLPDGAGPDTSWLRPRTPTAPHSRKPSSSEAKGHARTRTPLLNSLQVEHLIDFGTPRVVSEIPSRSDSTGSNVSSLWSEPLSVASSKSSAESGQASPKVSTAEHSGLLGGLVTAGYTPTIPPRTKSLTKASKANIPQSHIHPLLRQPSQPSGFDFDFSNDQISGHSKDESSTIESTIGAARVSSDSQLTTPTIRAISLTSQTCPSSPPRAASVEPTRKSRASGVFSAVTTPTSEMWDQYRAALTRPEPRSNGSSPTQSSSPTTSKIPHALKVSPFRFASRPNTPQDPEKKKEKRLSSFWRR